MQIECAALKIKQRIPNKIETLKQMEGTLWHWHPAQFEAKKLSTLFN